MLRTLLWPGRTCLRRCAAADHPLKRRQFPGVVRLQIIVALTILAIAVVLFLYFR